MSEILDFQTWTAENPNVTDIGEQVKQHALHLKEGYLASPDLSEDEKIRNIFEVNQGSNSYLMEQGFDEASIRDLNTPSSFSFDEELNRIKQSGIALDDEDAAKVRDYNAYREQIALPDTSETYIKDFAYLENEASEAVVSDKYQEAIAESYLDKNVAPFARVKVEAPDGEYEERLIGGFAAEGLTASEAYKKSLDVGAIRREDLEQVVDLMQSNSEGIPRYKINNYYEAQDGLAVASEEPDSLYNMHTKSLLRGFVEKGSFDTEEINSTIRFLRMEHKGLFNGIPDEDLAKSIEGQLGYVAMQGGMVDFNEDNVSENIQQYGYGQYVIHPDLLDSDSLFEQAIEGFGDKKKETLTQIRDGNLIDYFEVADQALQDTYLATAWSEAKAKGMDELDEALEKVDSEIEDPELREEKKNKLIGENNVRILKEFKENQDYSGFKNVQDEMSGKFVSSFASTYNAAGVIADNPEAIAAVLEHARKASSRRKVARLFGEDFEFGSELLGMGSALVSDATQVIGTSFVTAGVGAIPAVAGKLSLKAVVKTAVGNQIRKSLLKSAVTKGATMKISKSIAKGGTLTSMFKDTAASLASSGFVRQPAMLLQTGIQSGVNTYAAIYDALKDDKELSDEQKRDAAIYGGGAAGLLSMGLVGSFNLGNMAGVEMAIVQKASGREVKKILEKMSGVKVAFSNKEAAYRDAFEGVLKDGYKKFYGGMLGGVGGMLKSGGSEALEEGADEYFNTIIQAVATNEDLSFLEVASSAGWGGLYGLVLGAGGPAAQSAISSATDFVTGNRLMRTELVEQQVFQKVGKRAKKDLDKTGSAKAAKEFEKIFNRARTPKREGPAAQTPAAQTPAAQTPAAQTPAVEPVSFPQTVTLGGSTIKLRETSTADGVEQGAALRLELDPETDTDTLSNIIGESLPQNGKYKDAKVSAVKTDGGGVEVTITKAPLLNGEGNPIVDEAGNVISEGTEKLTFQLNSDGTSLIPDQDALIVLGSVLDRAKIREGSDPLSRRSIEPEEKDPNQLELPFTEAARIVQQEIRYEKAEKIIEGGAEATARIKEFVDQGFSHAEAKDIVIQELLSDSEVDTETPFTELDLGDEFDDLDPDDATDSTRDPDINNLMSKKQKRVEEAIEDLAWFGYPVKPKSEQYGLGSASNAEISKIKRAVEEKIKGYQSDPKSQHYIPNKSELASYHDYVQEDSIVENKSLSGAVSSPDHGFLFNNDPLAIKAAIDSGHIVTIPDSYSGPINTDVFVIVDGEVLDVMKPSTEDRSPVSALKNTSSSTLHDTKASENVIELGGVMGSKSSPLKLKFKQAGFYSKKALTKIKGLVSKKKNTESKAEFQERLASELESLAQLDQQGSFDDIFVLDGELTLSEALQRLNIWASENIRSITGGSQEGGSVGVNGVSGKIFSIASNINRLGLKNPAVVSELQETAFTQLLTELRLGLQVEYLRSRVSEISSEKNLDSDAALDEFVQSEEFVAFFDMKDVGNFLEKKENQDINLGRSKSWESNLNLLNGTPLQKISAFLYATTSGQGGLLNKKTFNDSFLSATRSKNKNGKWSLNDGWEATVAKQTLKGLMGHENFRKKNGPFPNFFSYSQRIGGRIRNKARLLKIKDSKQSELAPEESIANRAAPSPTPQSTVDNENISYDSFISRANQNIPTFVEQLTSSMSSKVKVFANRILSNKIDNDSQYAQELLVPETDFLGLSKAEQNFLVLVGYDTGEAATPDLKRARSVYENLYVTRNNAPNLITDADAKQRIEENIADIYRLALESGEPESVLAALKVIEQSGVDDSHKLVAELLLRDPEFIRSVNFEIVDDIQDSAGSFLQDEKGRGTVRINISSTYGKGVESILLHEYLHAFTKKLLSTDRSLLTVEQRRSLDKLEALRQLMIKEHAKNPKKFDSQQDQTAFEAGLANIDEFISSIFTSPRFQQGVRDLPQKGLLRRIINSIKQLFGIEPKTNLDTAFDDLVDFLNMDVVPDLAGRYLVERRIMQELQILKAEEVIEKSKAETNDNARKNFERKKYDSLENLSSDDDLTENQLADINTMIQEVAAHTMPASAAPVVILNNEQSEAEFKYAPNELFKTVQTPNEDGGSNLVILVNGKNSGQILARYGDVARNSIHLKMILEAELNSIFVKSVQSIELTDQEIDSAIAETSDGSFKNFAKKYIQDPTELENVLKAIDAGDVDLKRNLIRDMFADHYERATRGYTSYEDASFYLTQPNTARVLMRFFAGSLKKLSLQAKLRKNNPKLSRKINEISDEISYIKSGGRFNYAIKQFDIEVPDESLVSFANQISLTLNEITEDTTYEEIVAKLPMFKGYKIALGAFADGKYTSRTGIKRIFQGNLDPRILELKKQADAVQRAVEKSTETISNKITSYLKKNTVEDTILGDYLGRPDDIEISEEVETQIENEYRVRIRDYKNSGKEITSEQEASLYKLHVLDRKAAEKNTLLGLSKAKREAAASVLAASHPELHENLGKLRFILDSMSKIMKDEFGISGDLGAVIDSRLGVYVTRTYRAFTDEAYMDNVRRIMRGDFTNIDQVMVENYENALEQFKEFYIESEVRKREAGVSAQEARKRVEDIYNTDPAIAIQIKEAMRDYVESLDADKQFGSSKGGLKDGSIAKSIIDNLKRRKRVPPAIRKFLGQHSDSEVVNNVIRSVSILSRSLSRESMISNMIALGQAEGNNFVYSTDDLDRMGPEATLKLNIVNMRTGEAYRYNQEPEGLSEEDAEFNKGFHHYIDAEAFKQIQSYVQKQDKINAQESELGNWIVGGVQLAQGATLTAKTLFGIGFYTRNVIGNLGFFGPMQGLNPLTLTKHINQVGKVLNPLNSNESLRSIDAYQGRLLSLNVIQGDITSQLLSDLVNGNTNIDVLKERLQKESEKLLSAKVKLKAMNATAAVRKKTLDPVVNRMMLLSQAVDDFYKIGYYEFELSVLKRARHSDLKSGNDTGYKNLTDEDLEVMASKTVRDTSQSYVDSYEAIKDLSSRYGFVFASFLRFKTDTVRIFLATPSVITKEIGSSNPVIKMRGFRRLVGYSAIVGGVSILGAQIMRAIFGVSEEEDELNRKGLPEYRQNSTIWYFNWFGEQVQWDMTFLNPMSPVTNSLERLSKYAQKGQFLKGITEASGMFLNEFIESPILGQAWRESQENIDSVTKQKIYNDFDEPEVIFAKRASYILKNAFEPRALNFARKVIQTTKGESPSMSAEDKLGQLVMNEISPVRNLNVDHTNAFYSAMRETRDDLNASRSTTDKLASNQFLSDDDVEGIANTFYSDDLKIMKRARGWYKTSPLPKKEKDLIIKSLRLNSDVAKAIRGSDFKNRSLTSPTLDRLKKDEVLRKRGKGFQSILKEKPRDNPLD